MIFILKSTNIRECCWHKSNFLNIPYNKFFVLIVYFIAFSSPRVYNVVYIASAGIKAGKNPVPQKAEHGKKDGTTGAAAPPALTALTHPPPGH